MRTSVWECMCMCVRVCMYVYVYVYLCTMYVCMCAHVSAGNQNNAERVLYFLGA